MMVLELSAVNLLEFASSLFSVGRNVHPLLHQTAAPTWSVFLCSADRGVSLSRPDVP